MLAKTGEKFLYTYKFLYYFSCGFPTNKPSAFTYALSLWQKSCGNQADLELVRAWMGA